MRLRREVQLCEEDRNRISNLIAAVKDLEVEVAAEMSQLREQLATASPAPARAGKGGAK